MYWSTLHPWEGYFMHLPANNAWWDKGEEGENGGQRAKGTLCLLLLLSLYSQLCPSARQVCCGSGGAVRSEGTSVEKPSSLLLLLLSAPWAMAGSNSGWFVGVSLGRARDPMISSRWPTGRGGGDPCCRSAFTICMSFAAIWFRPLERYQEMAIIIVTTP